MSKLLILHRQAQVGRQLAEFFSNEENWRAIDPAVRSRVHSEGKGFAQTCKRAIDALDIELAEMQQQKGLVP